MEEEDSDKKNAEYEYRKLWQSSSFDDKYSDRFPTFNEWLSNATNHTYGKLNDGATKLEDKK